MKITCLRKVSAVLFFFILLSDATFAQESDWRAIFNGKDLKDWDTYLRTAPGSADTTPIGLNKDPHQVFSVVDGMMRISGQDWGGIAYKESFSNYHLRFQIKWGEKKWPPRANAKRDGGLLFHASEPYDFGTKSWMRSIELQIQEGDMADAHNVGAGVPVFQLSKTKTAEGQDVQQYDPFAPFMPTINRVYRSGNFESPYGEWTTGELVARGSDAVFIINGFVVNRLYNIFRMDLHEQVTSGRIQFQSESGEHYLRNIELRDIASVKPGKPVFVSDKMQVDVTVDQTQDLKITNNGEPVEIIAVELLGKDIDQFIIKLPAFPLVIKKGESMNLKASLKPGSTLNNDVRLKLETVYGPVSGFEIALTSK